MLHLASLLVLTRLGFGQLYPCPDPAQGECGRCKGHDDPHIMTFDGVFYDQHTDYCYKYVTECPFGASNPVPFDVCACHYDCGQQGGTGEKGCPNNIRCIGDVSLTFYDLTNGITSFEISIDYLNPSNPAVDTNIGSLSSGTQYTFDPSGNIFTYNQNGNEHNFAIEGSGFYGYVSYIPGDLEIYLDEAYFTGSACGLCGYFTQDFGNDDFTDSSGSIILSPTALQSGPSYENMFNIYCLFVIFTFLLCLLFGRIFIIFRLKQSLHQSWMILIHLQIHIHVMVIYLELNQLVL